LRLRFARPELLVARGALGGLAVLLYFTTIAHIDVSVATLLNFTSPVFMAIFAARILREPVGLPLAGALALTLGGVALITHAHAPPGSVGVGGWELLGLLSAVCSAGAVTAMRGLRLQAVGPWEIFTSFCVFGLLFAAPQALFHWTWPVAAEWPALLTVGILSVVAQICVAQALGQVQTAASGAVAQLTPIVTLILGALLLDEPVTAEGVAGAVITITGVLVAVRMIAARPASAPLDS
jgi:drug/metabolite transporter (DMT)-like permease